MKEIKIGETGLRELTELEVGHDTVGGNTERQKESDPLKAFGEHYLLAVKAYALGKSDTEAKYAKVVEALKRVEIVLVGEPSLTTTDSIALSIAREALASLEQGGAR